MPEFLRDDAEIPPPVEPPATPPGVRRPDFWSGVLVLWAVAYGARSAVWLVAATRGHWPYAAYPIQTRLTALLSGMMHGSLQAVAYDLEGLTFYLLVPLGIVGLWRHHERPFVFPSGVLLVSSVLIDWTRHGRQHEVWLATWTLAVCGGLGIIWALYRELPRSSRSLVALVAAAAAFDRGAAALATLVQMAWQALASRRPLIRRRDTRRRIEPRRRTRERLELAAVLLIVVLRPVMSHLLAPDPSVPTPGSALAAIPYHLGVAFIALSFLLRDSRFQLYLPRTRAGWWYEVGWGIWLYLLSVGIEAAARLVTAWLPWAPTVWESVTYTTTMRGVLFVEHFSNALREEIVFRAFLLLRLRPLLGNSTTWSVIVSAGLFSILHWYSLSGTVSLFAFGCLFGVVYVRTQSLTRLVLAHWLMNVVLTFSHR